MLRGRSCASIRAPRLLASALLLTALGCRADDEDCRAVAVHIVELAEAEGRGRGGPAALEDECKAQRPTSAMVQCLLAAETLADLDAC